MAKLLTLDEAAAALGLSVEQLTALRDRQGIGRRDVGTWKFTDKDVERLRAAMAAGDEDDSVFDSSAAIVLSEPDSKLGAAGSSSTIVTEGLASREKLGDDSNVTTQPISDLQIPDSDVKLVPGSGIGSDVQVVAGGKTKDDPGHIEVLDDSRSGDSSVLSDGDDDDAISLLPADSSVPLAPAGSDIELSSDSVDIPATHALSLDDAPIPLQGESSAKLSALDDDDVMLAPGGSDVTLNAGDSGISLADPLDAGLALDQPLDLAPADEPLELGRDDMLSIADDSDSQVVTNLKPDSDFLLTPLEEVSEADSEDSGSQVIALDDGFQESSGSFGAGLEAMLEEESPSPGGIAMDPLMGAAPAGFAAAAVGVSLPGTVSLPQTQFSMLWIIMLSICTLFMVMTGVMLFDLIRNMSSWDSPISLNSGLMDALAPLFGF